MVDMLVALQSPTELVGHDETVLVAIPIAIGHWVMVPDIEHPVALLVFAINLGDLLTPGLASHRAVAARLAGPDLELLAALRTGLGK
jgi:hypothetical protein